jgi:hypothetical protein
MFRFRRGMRIGVVAATAALLAACGTNAVGTRHDTTPSDSTQPASAMPPMAGMPGMQTNPAGDGLSATESGLTLQPAALSLLAGQDTTWSFRITSGQTAQPVTQFEPEQTRLMHLYVVRDDLTGFQHLHPQMAPEGTWTARLGALQPGSYRAYTQFSTTGSAGKPVTPVLSVALTVPGAAASVALPPAAPTAEVDGYTVAVDANVSAGAENDLSLTITRAGEPVTDLQPYLDSYAHLTAIHAGDMAFAHLHPLGTVDGDHGGPKLDFHAMLPRGGDWRLFIQFQTVGVPHTAQVTLHV